MIIITDLYIYIIKWCIYTTVFLLFEIIIFRMSMINKQCIVISKSNNKSAKTALDKNSSKYFHCYRLIGILTYNFGIYLKILKHFLLKKLTIFDDELTNSHMNFFKHSLSMNKCLQEVI